MKPRSIPSLEGVFDDIRLNSAADWRALESAFNESEQLKRLGMRVDLEDPDRPRTLIEKVENYHRGGTGRPFVNGGIISAMCDLAIGITGLKFLGEGRIATARLNIRFKKPLGGQRVTAVAWVRRRVGNRAFSAAEIRDAGGRLCARASGVVALGLRDEPNSDIEDQ